MKIETTALQIRAILELAEIDARMRERPPESLRSHREAHRRRISSALLDRYQALLDAGRWPAIVAVDRGGCAGCHVRLPTMIDQQLRRPGTVHACPHCRRLLYAPERLGEEDPGTSVSTKRRGAAASAGEPS